MALIFKRKPGECIEIGGATVRIGKIKGGQVALVIEAPMSVRIRKPSKAEDLIDRVTYAELVRKQAEKPGGDS